jgi:hypothetical protein
MDDYKKCTWLPSELKHDSKYDECMSIINRIRILLMNNSSDVNDESLYYQINICNVNHDNRYVDEFLNVKKIDLNISDDDKGILEYFGFWIEIEK